MRLCAAELGHLRAARHKPEHVGIVINAELRSRNVSDNGTLVSFSWPGVDIVRSSTEPVGTVRVGGNAGGAEPAAIDGFVRYTNIEFATGGWIGEAGPPTVPTAPRAPIGLQVR